MKSNKLEIRLRNEDKLLINYFKNIKHGDRAYEARRLLELAIKKEQKEKELIKKMNAKT